MHRRSAFDIGVISKLQGRAIRVGTPEFGVGFEAYIMHELAAYTDYRSGEDLHFWRSSSGFDVDLFLVITPRSK